MRSQLNASVGARRSQLMGLSAPRVESEFGYGKSTDFRARQRGRAHVERADRRSSTSAWAAFSRQRTSSASSRIRSPIWSAACLKPAAEGAATSRRRRRPCRAEAPPSPAASQRRRRPRSRPRRRRADRLEAPVPRLRPVTGTTTPSSRRPCAARRPQLAAAHRWPQTPRLRSIAAPRASRRRRRAPGRATRTRSPSRSCGRSRRPDLDRQAPARAAADDQRVGLARPADRPAGPARRRPAARRGAPGTRREGRGAATRGRRPAVGRRARTAPRRQRAVPPIGPRRAARLRARTGRPRRPTAPRRRPAAGGPAIACGRTRTRPRLKRIARRSCSSIRSASARRRAITPSPPRAARTLETIEIPDLLTVQELATSMIVPVKDVITELIKIGTMATINQNIPSDVATPGRARSSASTRSSRKPAKKSRSSRKRTSRRC